MSISLKNKNTKFLKLLKQRIGVKKDMLPLKATGFAFLVFSPGGAYRMFFYVFYLAVVFMEKGSPHM